jgi:tetratricopeptide (TPR) repeat protein
LSLYGTNSDVPVDETSAIGALGVASANDVMLDALRKLLPSLVDPGREIDLGLIANREPAAIASWVQGQRSYRFSRFEEALSHYQRALDEDSLLTSAALKGAQAANWSHQPDRARELIGRATAHGAELPTRHRLYLGGLSAYLDGQADTALARLAAALEHDPQWSEAWMLMGEVHEHLLPSTVSTDSAISMFRRAAADPGFTPPLIHLAEHAIREGRTADSRDLIRRLDRNGASAAVLADLETMATCAEDGPDAVEFPSRARSTPDLVYDVSVRLSPGAMQAECAAAGFAALLTADAWSTPHSWAAARGLYGLRVSVGDIAGAERFGNGIVESATLSQNPNLLAASRGMLWLSVLTAIAGAPMPSLTDRFEAIARERYGEGYAEIRGPFTAWLLGNWHGYNNDAAPLVRLRDYLASVADTTGSTQARLYADALSARVKILVDRDTAAAIERLERLISMPAPRDSVLNSLAAPFAPERLLLAELHLARGDYRRAHAVAAAFDHGATTFLPFIPASLRIRRDAALARGDDALASRYTRRLHALGHAGQDGDDTSPAPPATRPP